MKVGDLIKALMRFDPDLPVELSWSHGAEPGTVTAAFITRHQRDEKVLIRGEQRDC
jgi:hypothetical protein